jgi:hypothetical protein
MEMEVGHGGVGALKRAPTSAARRMGEVGGGRGSAEAVPLALTLPIDSFIHLQLRKRPDKHPKRREE